MKKEVKEANARIVEKLKKRAKSLVQGCRKGDAVAIDFIRRYHPSYAGNKSLDSLKLQEVQFAMAVHGGYKKWAELIENVLHDDKLNETSRLLVFTNGGHAAQLLREAGVEGDIVAWNDVLHEGPVYAASTLLEQSKQRVAHLASLNWVTEKSGKDSFRERDSFVRNASAYHRIELWFEHDLYDQLQLFQILAELGKTPELGERIFINQFDDYIGHQSTDVLAESIQHSRQVTLAEIEDANILWDAFRQESPVGLEELFKRKFSLQYARQSLERLCQEYPNRSTGLPRSIRQILKSLDGNPCNPWDLFKECQEMEEAIYLGDSSFWILLKRVTLGKELFGKSAQSGQIRGAEPGGLQRIVFESGAGNNCKRAIRSIRGFRLEITEPRIVLARVALNCLVPLIGDSMNRNLGSNVFSNSSQRSRFLTGKIKRASIE